IIPAGVGLAAIAPELVPAVFGKGWEESVALVQVLSLVAIATSLPWSAGDVFKAIGRPDIPTKLVLFESLYTFPLIIVIGVQTRQAVWIAVAYLIAFSITAVIRLWLACRFLGIAGSFYPRMLRAPVVASVIMALIVTLVRQSVESWPRFAILFL